jgi:hypothetical protein
MMAAEILAANFFLARADMQEWRAGTIQEKAGPR